MDKLPDHYKADWRSLTNACVDAMWSRDFQRVATRVAQRGGGGCVAPQADVDKIVGEQMIKRTVHILSNHLFVFQSVCCSISKARCNQRTF